MEIDVAGELRLVKELHEKLSHFEGKPGKPLPPKPKTPYDERQVRPMGVHGARPPTGVDEYPSQPRSRNSHGNEHDADPDVWPPPTPNANGRDLPGWASKKSANDVTATASEGTLMCLSFQGERRTVQVAGGRHAPPVIIVVQRTEIIEIGLGERTTLLQPGGKFQQHLPVVVTREIHKQATSAIVPEITNSSAKRGNVKHRQLQKTNQHT